MMNMMMMMMMMIGLMLFGHVKCVVYVIVQCWTIANHFCEIGLMLALVSAAIVSVSVLQFRLI